MIIEHSKLSILLIKQKRIAFWTTKQVNKDINKSTIRCHKTLSKLLKIIWTLLLLNKQIKPSILAPIETLTFCTNFVFCRSNVLPFLKYNNAFSLRISNFIPNNVILDCNECGPGRKSFYLYTFFFSDIWLYHISFGS